MSSTLINFVPETRTETPQRTWWVKFIRSRILSAMSQLKHGRVTVQDELGTQTFGQSSHACSLAATITITNTQFYRIVSTRGVLGAGEAYVAGYWQCDDLTALIRILIVNESAFRDLNSGMARLGRWISQGWHAFRRNTITGSRRNIAAHYDLSNDFYSLWLDDSMTYSAARYETPETPLEAAQLAKLDMICRKLKLTPEDHLLEIGTGWGSCAIHAAKHYGCRVTTTTISAEQHKLAAERIETEGLSGRITLLNQDYRTLTGKFDKIVSIEMIEAVGHEYYDTYFSILNERLRSNGLALIQAITVADRYYETARAEVDYIKRYVFPGSCIPSIGAITQSMARTSDLMLTHLEDFGRDYARTLRDWRTQFFAHIDQVRALGYSDAFIRLWDYYLCYCEAGFEERSIGVAQILISKPKGA